MIMILKLTNINSIYLPTANCSNYPQLLSSLKSSHISQIAGCHSNLIYVCVGIVSGFHDFVLITNL